MPGRRWAALRTPSAGAPPGGRRHCSGSRRSAWAAIISLILERNVVFHVVELAGRLLRDARRRLGLARLGGHRLRARLPRARARTGHLHAVGHDLGGVAILAFLVLPLARAQAPLHVDLRTLLQIFARDLGQPAAKHDAMPLGFLFLFTTGLVGPLKGRR